MVTSKLRISKWHPIIGKIIKGCTLDKILDDHYPDPEIRVKVVKRLYELEKLMKYDYTPGAEYLLKRLKELKTAHSSCHQQQR